MTKINTNPEITDNRRFRLVFIFPLAFRYKTVQTEITQRDVLKMIRQSKDSDVKKQLTEFIKNIDEESEYKTDINNQSISKDKRLMKHYERTIDMKDQDMRGYNA